MSWLSIRRVNGQPKADVARLPEIRHFAGVQLIARERNPRVFAAIGDFEFTAKGIANGAGVRIPREVYGLSFTRCPKCDR